MKSTPFLLKNFKIYESIFFNRPKSCVVTSSFDKNIVAFSRKFNKKALVKAALGEFQERLSCMKTIVKPESATVPFFKGFNLLDGSIINIPADFIIYNHDQPLFDYYPEAEYSDSSGMAAHLNSNLAIEKAYLEFVERQSLVYSWLKKDPGKIINIENLNDSKISLIYKNFKSRLNNLYVYEISIFPEIKVVLTLGFSNDFFSIGMGCDWDLKNAIKSSFDELNMIFESLITHKFFNSAKNSENIYVQEFYNKSITTFLNEVDYLLCNQNHYDHTKRNNNECKAELYLSIQNFSQRFNIELYATHIPLPGLNNAAKIVKVFSPEAYPHINTSLFDPKDYKITSSLSDGDFPNLYKMIPFA